MMTCLGCLPKPPSRLRSAFIVLGLVVFVQSCAVSHAPVTERGRDRTDKPAPVKQATTTAGKQSTGNRHHIKKGDTLYAIAFRYNMDFRQIADWNGLTPPYTIYAGRYLNLRPSAAARTSRPSRKTPRSTGKAPSPGKSRPLPSGAAPKWLWPTKGAPVANKEKNKLLIQGRSGQPVLAAADGKVVYSGDGILGYGNLLLIKHNEEYISAYGHNSRLLAKEGKSVRAGDPVAHMGNAPGRGAVLHFEIRRNGKPVDPLRHLPGSKTAAGPPAMKNIPSTENHAMHTASALMQR